MALDTIPKQEGGKLKAVASGTLPSGQPVIVNSDGTVSVISETSAPSSVGTPVVFEAANSNNFSAVYDASQQKVVVSYRDSGNSNHGTAVVGTVSGTSISFGTPVVYESAETDYNTATYDANAEKIVIAYQDYANSAYGTAVVGTVSGTSISFGTPVVFESASTQRISAAYDSSSQKVAIAYKDAANSNYGTAIVGTVSGTSISFGSASLFYSGGVDWVAATYDSNAQKVVIAYQENQLTGYGTAVVGTVTGTSISFGSPVTFESASSENISATYDTNAQKVVIAYRDRGNSDYGTAVVGTVSGTSISFGTPVVFNSFNTDYISSAYDVNAGKVVVAYRDYSDDYSRYGKAVDATVSGTSISFGPALAFESANSSWSSAVYDANAKKVVIAYSDVDNSSHGTAAVFQPAYSPTNLTSENYIGISTGGTYASGSNATVKIIGNTSDEQSGLTAGQAYYVQTDGTIGTTPADPSVFAGTAISATKLLVKT